MRFVDAVELEGALEVLAEHGDEAMVLAGGTDVMVQYLRGEISPNLLLHVRRIPELARVELDGRALIGASTTHWAIAGHAALAGEFRALAEAALTVGGRQTQNVGTVAGNVVNASPAADLLPPLLVADARVGLASKTGTRDVPLGDFLQGRRKTDRRPNELVTGLSLERPIARTGEVYLKVGRRRAMEVAVVGLAARVSFSEDGTIEEARVGLCSVAPKPFRSSEAEGALAGADPGDAAAIREAGEALLRGVEPIDDARATAAYRTRVLAPLLSRAIGVCRERANIQREGR